MIKDHILFLNQLKKKVNDEGGKIIYVTISGSDLYGFRSQDSDTDFRGSYQTRTNMLLGLKTPDDVIEYNTRNEKNEVIDEASLFELRKEIGLILNGNCNVFEHLYAEPLLTSHEHVELKSILEKKWNINGIYNSYRGMAYQNYTKFILNGKHTVKKYLYVVRALLAGIHAIKYYDIQPNIEELNYEIGNKIIEELIDLKKRGLEKDQVKRMDRYDQVCDLLFKEIDQTYEKEKYDNKKELEEVKEELNIWLKRKRLEYIET